MSQIRKRVGKMKKKSRKSNLWLFAALLLLPLLAVPVVYGAYGIETDRACSVAIQLNGEYAEDLNKLAVPVKLYRVASVGADGKYTPLEGFGSLDLSSISSETAAQQWEKLAEQASEIVKAGGPAPAAEIQMQNGRCQAGGLATGMYLMEAESVQSSEYIYNFAPNLAALPNNYYGDPGRDDAWVYDVDDMLLKPEQVQRLGSLVIRKRLTAYNATFGGADFVFRVEAEKGGKSVYSDVVSLAFDAPGEKSLRIDGIPAGATVKVEEIYSGASYSLTGDAVQTAVITAEGEAGNPVEVSFENAYDERPNGGSGIVNHFRYQGGEWTAEKHRDSAAQ